MSVVSTQMIVSNLIGGLISGLITWLVAHLSFRKQDVRAEQVFEALARFLEKFAEIVNKGGDANVGFIRDGKGRIVNANMQFTLKAEAGGVLVEGHLLRRYA